MRAERNVNDEVSTWIREKGNLEKVNLWNYIIKTKQYKTTFIITTFPQSWVDRHYSISNESDH